MFVLSTANSDQRCQFYRIHDKLGDKGFTWCNEVHIIFCAPPGRPVLEDFWMSLAFANMYYILLWMFSLSWFLNLLCVEKSMKSIESAMCRSLRGLKWHELTTGMYICTVQSYQNVLACLWQRPWMSPVRIEYEYSYIISCILLILFSIFFAGWNGLSHIQIKRARRILYVVWTCGLLLKWQGFNSSRRQNITIFPNVCNVPHSHSRSIFKACT